MRLYVVQVAQPFHPVGFWLLRRNLCPLIGHFGFLGGRGTGRSGAASMAPLLFMSGVLPKHIKRPVSETHSILQNNPIEETVTLGCFTNGTIAQVVTNSLSPLSGQHLYDGSGATV